MARQVKISKHYMEWGRRVRGARKGGRSGPSGKKSIRKVFYETPENRCEKHHAYRAKCGC